MSKIPTGTSIRLHLSDCGCADALLHHHALLAPKIRAIVEGADCTPLAFTGHDFEGGGMSLCWVLAESHVAVHSWPEVNRTVLLELSVCDHLRPNRERARALADGLVELFEARRVGRDELAMLPDLDGENA